MLLLLPGVFVCIVVQGMTVQPQTWSIACSGIMSHGVLVIVYWFDGNHHGYYYARICTGISAVLPSKFTRGLIEASCLWRYRQSVVVSCWPVRSHFLRVIAHRSYSLSYLLTAVQSLLMVYILLYHINSSLVH